MLILTMSIPWVQILKRPYQVFQVIPVLLLDVVAFFHFVIHLLKILFL